MNNEYVAHREIKRERETEGEKGEQQREDVCIPLMKNSMAGQTTPFERVARAIRHYLFIFSFYPWVFFFSRKERAIFSSSAAPRENKRSFASRRASNFEKKGNGRNFSPLASLRNFYPFFFCMVF